MILASDPHSGLRLIAAQHRRSPVLNLLIPGQPDATRGIEIECPEHVWGRRQGEAEACRLHQGALDAGEHGAPVSWRRDDDRHRCELPCADGISLTITATLERDGLRLAYDFANAGAVDFAEVQAVTCVQMHDAFADRRLERTWIHHHEGFALLADGMRERVHMPLAEWLPCRWLAPFRWPVAHLPSEIVDGIRRNHVQRAIDEPFIITGAQDGAWLAATCTRECGNVWSNPERTCHHADPSAPLAPGRQARVEVKIFVVQSDLQAVLDLVRAERQRPVIGVQG
jgi:hypothetical protein